MNDEHDDAGSNEPSRPPPQPAPASPPSVGAPYRVPPSESVPGSIGSEPETGNPIRMKLGNKIRQFFER